MVPTGRGFRRLSTCVGSGYGHHALFSRALGSRDLRTRGLRSLPAMTASTMFPTWTGRLPRSLFPTASISVHDGTGMLTSFPFVTVVLRRHLGPADPRLIDSAEEPLLIWPSGISPDSRCYCDQDCHHRTVHTISRPCFYPTAAPSLLDHPVMGAAGSRWWI